MGHLWQKILPWSKKPPERKAHIQAFIDQTTAAEQERQEAEARRQRRDLSREEASPPGCQGGLTDHEQARCERCGGRRPAGPPMRAKTATENAQDPTRAYCEYGRSWTFPEALPPRTGPKSGILGMFCPRRAMKKRQQQQQQQQQGGGVSGRNNANTYWSRPNSNTNSVPQRKVEVLKEKAR
ncbi:hypothetical protein GGTG_05610 [Gaeumannomyces tritici R3-111a-1]|uniref:Uncharacterized protein n=1 Tax=Gaeumannomyces tritici (strain R3-111a-1) TaxID=644352 RepID=J3NWE6_GAET3|nr:hypothetical protein GGTG_05610 [Gaeumannomyces tritici R3-111a-1]EJT75678.1 hypothetical protein GGTG_05610 [Gaeumannomyces tritici R3-111a-1]